MFKNPKISLIIAFLLLLFSSVLPVYALPNTLTEEKIGEDISGFKIYLVDPKDILPEEAIDEIPLLDQRDYPDTPYSHGTVSTSGCGITCAAMLISYYTDTMVYPDELAEMFNDMKYSNAEKMENALEYYNVPFIEMAYGTDGWIKVMEALTNGQPVISLQHEGLFTSGGHFILLAGLTEDGKIIVLDPNGWNYDKNDELKAGFANGFTEDQILASNSGCWIFGPKPEKEEIDESVQPRYSYLAPMYDKERK